VENLQVLDAPILGDARQAELRAHGDYVYARSKAWSAETWTVAAHPEPRAHATPRIDEPLSDWIERPTSISQDL
jgi:hypothetical protein